MSEGVVSSERNVTKNFPVMDTEDMKDVRQQSSPHLLVIVGEPFDEIHKASIVRRIATGLPLTRTLFIA